MNLTELARDASRLAPQSALRYRAVNVTSANYSTDTPFRAIILANPGNVTVVGIDGVAVAIPLQAGVNPCGGIGINTAGTTSTTLHVAF
jgi:hypothetical protein